MATDSDRLEEIQTECEKENRKRKSVEDETCHVKTGQKFRHPFLGELCNMVQHPPQSCKDGAIEQARVKTTTENE